MLVLKLPSRFPLRVVLALLLGGLHAASFVEDHAWPIQIAAQAGLVALVLRATREFDGIPGLKRAAWSGARAGFGFGLGWFVTGISWIFISLHTYGEMNAVVAGAGVLALAAYLSLFPALACSAFAFFAHARRPGPLASVAAFASLWTLSEMARGTLLTGFPWLATGYAHVGGPLAGYAAVIGVYGITLLAAAIATVVALAATRRRRESLDAMIARRRFTVVLAIVFGVPFAGQLLRYAEWSAPFGAPISVRLLQGNVAQDLKFVPGRFDATADEYMTMVEARRADLVVLPETAFPRFVADLPEGLVRRVIDDARTQKSAIAFGVAVDEGGARYFNSVLAVDGTGKAVPAPSSGDAAAPAPPTMTLSPAAAGDQDAPEALLAAAGAQRYDKAHLVPFGEFIPTGFHWFVALMRMPLGDFTRGTTSPRPMHLAGLRVAFNVCYEDLFGEEILRQADAAHVLVNVSNVAWFGDSMALPQHLDISRMRALETARPMLRATNTGMTAHVDPHGRVLKALPSFEQGSLDVEVQGMTGTTPFMWWGNGAALVLALALGAGAWTIRRR